MLSYNEWKVGDFVNDKSAAPLVKVLDGQVKFTTKLVDIVFVSSGHELWMGREMSWHMLCVAFHFSAKLGRCTGYDTY